MRAILYTPAEPPRTVSPAGFTMPDRVTGLVRTPPQAAELLECAPTLVDVLASGADYVAFSIFDFEGEVNYAAMEAVAKISGHDFDVADEDHTLAGPVLIVYEG
ncbi:hypothetical protein GCM10027044_40850 [Hymenobacter ruber]